ncbi:type II toxin-antitoxin system Rv0910 family toxin [Nocardia niigatensis]|uniref:type II toxin-antitoxin system Rv0910 family toxin n=1 Tax=Nocardia niigatensis TaxID=209249 RepID=UPI0003147822|nr:SRPBCC family protein [Nocardia niigatensis]
MRAIVVSREVPGTPEALFTTIASPSTWEHWMASHRDFVDDTPDRLTEGSTLVAEILMHGMIEEIEWTVTRLDDPNRIVLYGNVRTGWQCDLTYWLIQSENGTTVTASVVLTGPAITGTIATLVEGQGRQQLGRTLGQLGALAGSAGRLGA